MSKKNIVPMAGGTSAMPKVLGTLIVLGLLVLVVKHPADAALWVQELAAWVGSVVDGIAAFFQQLAA
ncbi:hypothetical protein B0I33_10910 [Prauserella shujinwangii]|uniref:Uncharacterized protein n=1 Tax=Prauserella shujinwangii TaxID=1453103 RepID=A0A2T0LPU5_9PSEU|nr:hypothetical protein [Prauserella shujinwangii]PRX45349.1 hypothetical protein B0I33_10910 [Prauserella shujinwangii]